MEWQNVRLAYPHRWLLVEAVSAISVGGKRIVNEMDVIEDFPDALTAWQGYAEAHRKSPEREYYVVHTDREELDIRERRELAMRGVRELSLAGKQT
jgi:hypothetical protein